MKKIFQIIIIYILAVATLKSFAIIQTSWLLLLSPFWLIIILFFLYFVGIWIASGLYIRRINKQKKQEDFDTEVSFICHGCAKPFDKPVKHRKGEFIFHKHCTPKN